MSTSSSGSLGRRIAKRGKPLRASTNKLPHVSQYDAYDFALRVAYLHHLLQPKAKRLQHEAAAKPQLTRQPTSVAELVKDSFVVRDSKSTRLPKDFMSALDKRLTRILTGQERMQEYNDAAVKRIFAIFLNEFKRPDFRRSMDQDRKVEDLLLIFFSNATKELAKTVKSPEDDSYKLMVDRYVALFVRLVSSIMKDKDWAKEKPELCTRLQTLENKLLTHDRDLAAASQRNGGAGGTTVEVEVPRSQNVKDMPMVLTVASVFNKDLSQVQGHIDEQREFLTEKSALSDLKMYQTSLSLNSRRTLRKDDFDTDEAYDIWRKSEDQDISQMMFRILQSSPDLARSTPGTLPQNRAVNGVTDHSRSVSLNGIGTAYQLDHSFDFGNLNMNGDTAQTSSGSEVETGEPYMFIPPDPHAYYRQALKQCWLSDMRDEAQAGTNGTADLAGMRLLSKKSTELLNELAMRWRIPSITRLILFKDVLREMLNDHNLELGTLDTAMTHIKDVSIDPKRSGSAQTSDPTLWPMADYAMNQQILTAMHDTLLRDLFEELLQCFNIKPIEIGGIMTVLENHIYDDPLFTKSADDLDQFTDHLHDALLQKAQEFYDGLTLKHLHPANRDVEFFDIMELGKDVLKHGQRVQKRYRKISTIMGVQPAVIFVQVVLPAYASDAKEQVSTVLEQAKARQEEVPMEDGFELYREMVQMRQIHNDVLPNIDFAFHVEGLLAPFVWRWIATTDQNIPGWVEAAVKQDQFQTRNQQPNMPPSEDERHSVSVIDVFRSFNEAINQIVSLNWDDDYQYAKFMTALSKSIGAGLTRYCEQLERYFVQEMDRLTPEQEVTVNQTRQERWVRIAKDAMSTKDKIEPFQFLPESFVKLNNIEWAMIQLDKLEKEMNVDACAAVIDKHEPQKPTQRKAESYVFTVKIIEAEDLKACDVNGLSDPYVVLGDEYQKRLAKTRIIYGNLNPRWDETTDIITQGPLNVIATIWDWDVMGDHDMVGRTSIKLDPSHFRDFLPREYWLDLDTQGRLLVRVSMEGEKDDIRFYFGKAFRTLKRSEREMTRKITDKLSAYIHHCLSKRILRSLTSKPISIQSVSNYFQRNRPPPTPQRVPAVDIENALQPLFAYFNENFAIMKQILTNNAMITVMTRLWKETLATLESLLVPPLSDKASAQRQLNEQELEIVFRWLECLFDFFHAYDDETKTAQGVPQDILKSPKYHDLKNLNFFYYEPTDILMRESERMAVATMDRQREAQARSNYRLSAPGSMSPGPSFAGTAGLMGLQTTRRSKTVMNSRNLGTMKKAKQEKRQEAQAEPSDDMILRILRMRPEAERYLRDRSRQKERLAAAAAAEMIVQQSLAQGAAREREIRREMAMNRR